MKIGSAILLLIILILSCQGKEELEGDKYKVFEHAELDSLISVVETDFSTDSEFILNSRDAQFKWKESTLADINMRFPNPDKQEYGSIYTTCYLNYIDEAIVRRITYIQQWIIGKQEGEVCAGSIPISYEE